MDEQSIFLEALQKETPEERTAFLAEACGGDEGVRHEIEMLLKAHNKVGGFLQGAPAGIENDSRPTDHRKTRHADRPLQTASADRRRGHGRGLYG